jgi:hypothetical protein
LQLEQLEPRRVLATLVVNSVADNFDPANPQTDGIVTLREAVLAANLDAAVGDAVAGSGDDTIEFATPLSGQTISLTHGQLELTDVVDIDATSLTNGLTIDAQGQSRVFEISAPSGDFRFAGLTLTGGHIGGIRPMGGALRSSTVGDVTIEQSVITGNEVVGDEALRSETYGGGISTNGDLYLFESTVADNRVEGSFASGGGVYSGGRVVAVRSAISGNSALASEGGYAGGIHGYGGVTLSSSTVSDNLADGAGGGVVSYHSVVLTNSTVTGNVSGSSGGGIFAYGYGGDVFLTDSTVSENVSGHLGGGIFASEFVSLNRSLVDGNTSYFSGGGIFADRVSSLRSTISNNSTTGEFGRGGGINGIFRVFLDGSTVTGNETFGAMGHGAGIRVSWGSMELVGSTISGNVAHHVDAKGGGVYGGGHYHYSANFISDGSTITNNAAGTGGGVFWSPDGYPGGEFLMTNLIVAGNSASVDQPDVSFDGTVSATFSLIGDATDVKLSGSGNLSGTTASPLSPGLVPLANNGGTTLTHLLLPNSPAINMGDPTILPGGHDQRGVPFARVSQGRLDMGAVEFIETDFDGDELFGCADVDALVAEIVAGTNDPALDLNSDAFVNQDDLATWLAVAGYANIHEAYRPGDANLDGLVDEADFLIWSANKFTNATGWCSADFNADGGVGGQDFLLWNANKFQTPFLVRQIAQSGSDDDDDEDRDRDGEKPGEISFVSDVVDRTV